MYITKGRVFRGTPNILIFWLLLENLSISEQTIDGALIYIHCRTIKLWFNEEKIISYYFHHRYQNNLVALIWIHYEIGLLRMGWFWETYCPNMALRGVKVMSCGIFHAFHGVPTCSRWFFIAVAIHSSWSRRRPAPFSMCSFWGFPSGLMASWALGMPKMLETLMQPISPRKARSCMALLIPPYWPVSTQG